MNIIFFGTSNVALPILEALHQQHKVLLVVTSPDAPVGKKKVMQESPVSALARDLKLETIKPEKVKGNSPAGEELLETLKAKNADIFIVVSYGKILPEELLNMPRLKTLNVHFSLLPKYRGAAPIQYALLNGETETGTTIFILDKDLDHGPILSQAKVSIDEDDTFITLAERAAHISAPLLLNTIEAYEDGKMTPQEQDHSLATNTKIISKADGKIDWNKTAQEIYNQFRAFYPWPGIWTTWEDKVIKILACHVAPQAVGTPQPPGTVTPDGLIWCGKNTQLFISELQLAGKTATDIQSFLRGYPQFSQSKLS